MISSFRKSCKSLLRNIKTTRENDEITTLSNKIPLLTANRLKKNYLRLIPLELEKRCENDTLEGVHIPSTKYTKCPPSEEGSWMGKMGLGTLGARTFEIKGSLKIIIVDTVEKLPSLKLCDRTWICHLLVK